MKILRALWFNESGSMAPIGIVIIETPEGQKKAYIGTGYGRDEGQDSQKIASMGDHFPMEAASILE